MLYSALHPVQARANGGTLPRVQKARVIVELHLGWMLRLLYLVRSLPPLSHEHECLLARSQPHDAIDQVERGQAQGCLHRPCAHLHTQQP